MAAKLRTIAILTLSLAVHAGCVRSVRLAVDGRTDYRIAVPDEAPVEVGAAAQELAHFLEQVTGAEFPIVKASEAKTDRLIVVGRGAASRRLISDTDFDSLGSEGFIIRTTGPMLLIAGAPWRGTVNGVYTFLEDLVGCRWYSPTFSVIPRIPNLHFGPVDVRYVPAFESRFVYSGSGSDAAWAARQRLNTFTRDICHESSPDGTRVDWDAFMNDPRISGSWHYVRWHVHTLAHDRLLPYAAFDRHPEYFALVDGKRLRHGQPCLTNPGLKHLIADRIRQWIREDPTGRILSISQGDFGNACQCDACRAGYKDGGMTAAYMRYVNEVAAQLETESPDLMIDTLAYKWTRTLPPGTTMRKNTVIRYCTINACQHHAFDECGYNRQMNLVRDMRQWVAAAPRVWVWYYAIPRSDLLPYANLDCLARNFKLMRDIGIRGYFIQAELGRTCLAGGLTELQAYLFAKLLWNPDYNMKKGIEQFARDSYGAAAPQMLAYIRAVNDADTYTGIPEDSRNYERMKSHGGFHVACTAVLPLEQGMLRDLDVLFDEAERIVADDPGSLRRVRLVRLSLQYALILFAEADDPARLRAIREFFPVARQAGVPEVLNTVNGRNQTLNEFEKSILSGS